jgi:hypothetical protein
MKKQFLIFATLTTIVFMSCSKEQTEGPQNNQPEEVAGAMNNTSQQRGALTNTLDKDLIARYEFDANLKDMTGKVQDATPFLGKPVYTNNRKGVKNSAIRFDETYGINLWDVPLDTNMSISFWIKPEITPTIVPIPVVEGSHSFSFIHNLNNSFRCGYWDYSTFAEITTRPIFGGWRHMAATRSNNEYKFYLDGVLVGTRPILTGGLAPKNYSEYSIGYGMNAGYRMWRGNIDDLRIYRKVLTTSEVSTLKNL